MFSKIMRFSCKEVCIKWRNLIALTLIILNLSGVVFCLLVLFIAFEEGHVGGIYLGTIGVVVNLLAVIFLSDSHYDQLIRLSLM
ncbi:hypothetical protein JOD82_002316 [Paenibacillus sp. 1182]|nr:hypothetical protein [Paenibacillus sp. 1182]